MKTILNFSTPGFIEHPYWPEMYRVIEIQKRSGVNRARTDANRRRALESYLNEVGMTLADYEALVQRSARPFHTDSEGHILIPAEKILACLVNAADVAPSKLRIPSIRTTITASDFVTDRTTPDGTWERFAVVTLGAGNKASNQRGFRSNAFIRDFSARGSLTMEPEMVDPKAVIALLTFAGRVVGIGASRGMGWGRFTVEMTDPRAS
jgi:hypothetical protein